MGQLGVGTVGLVDHGVSRPKGQGPGLGDHVGELALLHLGRVRRRLLWIRDCLPPTGRDRDDTDGDHGNQDADADHHPAIGVARQFDQALRLLLHGPAIPLSSHRRTSASRR